MVGVDQIVFRGKAPWTLRHGHADHDPDCRSDRLEGQAPDIDPLVYLTDCDPSALAPGQFIQAEIVGSRAYAASLKARGTEIAAVVCVDMIGFTHSHEKRVTISHDHA